ncbi:hypothetical protein V2O64_24555 (plasmid) [Verrucomicrobiaceae bacterium 227]
MPWIALTSAHIKARLAEEELEEIEATGGGDGDRLSGIIEQVTSLVRASVAACHKNQPGPDGTIPEECLHAAATIAKHDIRASLPTTGGDDDNKLRIEEYRDATGFLKSVARCEIGIENHGGGIAGRDSGCFGGDPKHDF